MTVAEQILSINSIFYCRFFKGEARVIGISEMTNTLSVEITNPEGHRWIEEDWDLQHTIWGFERGDYSFTKLNNSK